MCHIYDPEEGEKFIAFFFTYETNYEEVANALLNKFDSVISEIKYQNGHKFFRVMINQEDQVFDKLYHLRLDFERVLFDQLHAVRSEFKDIIKTWRNQEEEINVHDASVTIKPGKLGFQIPSTPNAWDLFQNLVDQSKESSDLFDRRNHVT